MPFVGSSADFLSFPTNAKIIVISKDKDLWVGSYKNKIGWFPSNYVQEINQNDGLIDSLLNYDTIELAGSTFEIVSFKKIFN